MEQDFRSFDWDDTELIRAYNKGLEARKAKNKGNKDNKRRKWKVGDYCRALYTVDNLYYEAKIVSMNGDFCTVEFLGYEETEDIDLMELKESEGKKARKQQIKACMTESSVHESETAGDTTDGTVVSRNSHRKKKTQVNQTVNNETFDTTMYEGAFHQQYSAPSAVHAPGPLNYYPPPPPAPLPFMAPPATLPQCSMPFSVPMPQCPNLANNPATSSMLTAWYMAGYYTGIHSVQAQKDNHGCQRCCSHSNQCCRN